MRTQCTRLLSALFVLSILLSTNPTIASAYDPLGKADSETDSAASKTLYVDITDASRQREIPVKIYLPT